MENQNCMICRPRTNAADLRELDRLERELSNIERKVAMTKLAIELMAEGDWCYEEGNFDGVVK